MTLMKNRAKGVKLLSTGTNQTPCAISKNLRLPRRAPRILWMRSIGRDSSSQSQKHRSRVFVRGNRVAKRHVPQVLQRIRQSVIRRVTRLPQQVALRKFFGCERRQSQQIVRPVLDHVDAQIVSRVDAKIRPVRVAKSEPLQF